MKREEPAATGSSLSKRTGESLHPSPVEVSDVARVLEAERLLALFSAEVEAT